MKGSVNASHKSFKNAGYAIRQQKRVVARDSQAIRSFFFALSTMNFAFFFASILASTALLIFTSARFL